MPSVTLSIDPACALKRCPAAVFAAAVGFATPARYWLDATVVASSAAESAAASRLARADTALPTSIAKAAMPINGTISSAVMMATLPRRSRRQPASRCRGPISPPPGI